MSQPPSTDAEDPAAAEAPTPTAAAEADQARALLAPASRYRSGMLRRFGPIYHALGLGLWLRRLRLEEHSAENIRQAASRGPLIYVLHTRSQLDWLALNRVLNRRRLPLARFSNGIRSTRWAPIPDALRELWDRIQLGWGARRDDPIASGWLANAVARDVPCALFLVEPPDIKSVLTGPPPDPVAALLDAQDRCPRPIQVVPVVVAWQRKPEAARTEAARILLGSADEPGPLQKLLSVAARTEGAIVQAGEPVALPDLLERYDGEPRARQVRALRILLRRYLYREQHVIRGPRVRPYRWMRRLVVGSPEVREVVRSDAAARGVPEVDIQIEVEQTLDKMAARISYRFLRFMRVVLRFVFERIWSGIDIRPEDLETLRTAFREGTPVLIPSHKSHLDYLLLSYVMDSHDIVIPHIVAGDNLSFWPLGPLMRRGGAFFIKRSFKDAGVFPVVFERYLRQLIRDGFPVEFFIEGGRSRTGKLLPAKHGVLGMVLDASARGRDDRKVTLLPINICYEQIAEARAYARELAGEKKKSEDIGQVVAARKVLAKRLGKVYVRIGAPMTTAEVFEEAGGGWTALDREHRREALQRVGEALVHRIGEATVVLPTGVVAMALLAQSRRGVRLTQLYDRTRRIWELLVPMEQRPDAVFQFGGWMVEGAMKRFERERLTSRLDDEEGVIIQVHPDKRLELEYYKNTLIHKVALASMVAAALRALQPREGNPLTPAQRVEARRLFQVQVFLLRYELTPDPTRSLSDALDDALAQLVSYGALTRSDAGFAVASPARITELAELTRNFLESYVLTLRAARALRSRDIALDDLPARIAKVGEGLLAVDELSRPECLSVVNLKNAVRAFQEEGVLQIKSSGGLHFAEEACQQTIADLKALLA